MKVLGALTSRSATEGEPSTVAVTGVSRALSICASPAPTCRGAAGVPAVVDGMAAVFMRRVLARSMRSAAGMPGERVARSWRSRALIPDTLGAAMEVPDLVS